MRTFVIGILAMLLLGAGGWVALDRFGAPATDVSTSLGSVRLEDTGR
jgi:hypothetical protein